MNCLKCGKKIFTVNDPFKTESLQIKDSYAFGSHLNCLTAIVNKELWDEVYKIKAEKGDAAAKEYEQECLGD